MTGHKRVNVFVPDDGYLWLRTGEKKLQQPKVIRAYFKCSNSRDSSCKVRKIVDFNSTDPRSEPPVVSYTHDHNHPPPLRKSIGIATEITVPAGSGGATDGGPTPGAPVPPQPAQVEASGEEAAVGQGPVLVESSSARMEVISVRMFSGGEEEGGSGSEASAEHTSPGRAVSEHDRARLGYGSSPAERLTEQSPVSHRPHDDSPASTPSSAKRPLLGRGTPPSLLRPEQEHEGTASSVASSPLQRLRALQSPPGHAHLSLGSREEAALAGQAQSQGPFLFGERLGAREQSGAEPMDQGMGWLRQVSLRGSEVGSAQAQGQGYHTRPVDPLLGKPPGSGGVGFTVPSTPVQHGAAKPLTSSQDHTSSFLGPPGGWQFAAPAAPELTAEDAVDTSLSLGPGTAAQMSASASGSGKSAASASVHTVAPQRPELNKDDVQDVKKQRMEHKGSRGSPNEPK